VHSITSGRPGQLIDQCERVALQEHAQLAAQWYRGAKDIGAYASGVTRHLDDHLLRPDAVTKKNLQAYEAFIADCRALGPGSILHRNQQRDD
jgi:hypothetical protein